MPYQKKKQLRLNDSLLLFILALRKIFPKSHKPKSKLIKDNIQKELLLIMLRFKIFKSILDSK